MKKFDNETIFWNWIESYIIQLNLCPFAIRALEKDQICLQILNSSNVELQLLKFLSLFNQKSHMQYETAFMVLADDIEFIDYLDYYYFLEDILTEKVQLQLKAVAFHPEYKHGNNELPYLDFTNRSPFPVIQVIRTSTLNKIQTQDVVDNILKENALTLQNKGIDYLQTKIDELRRTNQ